MERAKETGPMPSDMPSPDERYSQGWFAAKKDYAAAIRAEFLGGSKP